jgi:hypothetical protein
MLVINGWIGCIINKSSLRNIINRISDRYDRGAPIFLKTRTKLKVYAPAG